MHGLFNLHKPLRITSHDVVAQIRRGLRIKKVGHAGTLDPLASGVLIVCLGNATRLSEYLMASTKRYHARVKLGVNTTTYDAEGEITAQQDASAITRADLEAILPRFLGAIDQIPPIYSAIKQGGKSCMNWPAMDKATRSACRLVPCESITSRSNALSKANLS